MPPESTAHPSVVKRSRPPALLIALSDLPRIPPRTPPARTAPAPWQLRADILEIFREAQRLAR
jgi:hypothetical protein